MPPLEQDELVNFVGYLVGVAFAHGEAAELKQRPDEDYTTYAARIVHYAATIVDGK
jgi:hypothetical protein